MWHFSRAHSEISETSTITIHNLQLATDIPTAPTMTRNKAILRGGRALLERSSNPPILPVPLRAHGNNVPHSMTKTRRTWKPNTKRYNLPVNIIGGAMYMEEPVAEGSRLPRYPEVSRVKMRARDIKDVAKAGGLEGMLVSAASEIASLARTNHSYHGPRRTLPSLADHSDTSSTASSTFCGPSCARRRRQRLPPRHLQSLLRSRVRLRRAHSCIACTIE